MRKRSVGKQTERPPAFVKGPRALRVGGFRQRFGGFRPAVHRFGQRRFQSAVLGVERSIRRSFGGGHACFEGGDFVF